MKFCYFDLRAKGEITRLIAAAADVQLVDERIAMTKWPEVKPSTPLGQLPFLVLDDGTVLPQSMAIARYLAKKHGLASDCILENAKIDAVVDTLLDPLNSYIEARFHSKGEDQKALLLKFKNEEIPLVLGRLEKLKKMYGSEKHMVGDKLTWADLFVFDNLENYEEFNKEEVAKHKGLLAVRESVMANKGVAKYLAKKSH
ncbi:hypothetical protein ACOME3_005851 [Neoechinorhynchus agilis]